MTAEIIKRKSQVWDWVHADVDRQHEAFRLGQFDEVGVPCEDEDSWQDVVASISYWEQRGGHTREYIADNCGLDIRRQPRLCKAAAAEWMRYAGSKS